VAVLDAEELVARLRRDVERSVLRTRNGLRLMTGVGKPVTGASPRDAVWSAEKVRLYRYRSEDRRWNTPLLFVHSLVSKTYVFDLAPGNSFVETMLRRGHDVYLLDWGTPDELEAANTLETYSDDYIPAAVREVLRTSAADDVNVFGYCFGGILSLLYAAGHTDDPVRSLSVMATPIDFSHMGALASVLRDGHVDAEDLLDSTGNVPADVIAQGFRMTDPMSAVTEYVDLWQHMWNDDYLKSYRTVMAWAKDQIPFPGTAFVQMQNELVRPNALPTGRVPLHGGEVDFADIRVPFNNIIGEKDTIVPPEATIPLTPIVGAGDGTETRLRGGHVGLVVGRTAQRHHIPAMASWIESRMEAP
jgi:polyhydroxyalkanoate synthase subunit PhaC